MTGSDNVCYVAENKGLSGANDSITFQKQQTPQPAQPSGGTSLVCAVCATPLTGRQRVACSPACRGKWMHILHPQQGSGNHNFKGWRSKQPILYTSKFKHANPEKVRAHQAVAAATRKGALVRPEACSVCSAACRPDAHHEDYTKPLAVVWLCRRCHGVRDRSLAARRADSARAASTGAGAPRASRVQAGRSDRVNLAVSSPAKSAAQLS